MPRTQKCLLIAFGSPTLLNLIDHTSFSWTLVSLTVGRSTVPALKTTIRSSDLGWALKQVREAGFKALAIDEDKLTHNPSRPCFITRSNRGVNEHLYFFSEDAFVFDEEGNHIKSLENI